MACLHCIETDTETDKNGLLGLCGGVHIAQRLIATQIPVGFCVLVFGICLGLVSDSVNEPLSWKNMNCTGEMRYLCWK